MSMKIVRPLEAFNHYANYQISSEELGIYPEETITVGGGQLSVSEPPEGLVNREDLGLLINDCMSAQRILAWPPPWDFCSSPRGLKTPGGDYLLFSVVGRGHYSRVTEHYNLVVAHRSSDRGRTWSAPTMPWEIDFNQHMFIPSIVGGSDKIVGFGAQPIWGQWNGVEECPIGYRTSTDDGHTWSDLTIVYPVNDLGFIGRFCSRWCETEKGTWLVGAYTDRTPPKSIPKRQYLLRGENQGERWELLPDKRPSGWVEPSYEHMMEASLIALPNGEVLLMGRTAEGHLWEMRSDDDGVTWSDPRPTALAHPDVSPMIFHLSDGKTLIVFIHNRDRGGLFVVEDRSELWASLSSDNGRTWSEPRFVMANAAKPCRGMVSVSYADAIIDGDEIHLFTDHLFRQIVQVSFKASDLEKLPTKAELVKR